MPSFTASFRWEATIQEHGGIHHWQVSIDDEAAAQRVLPLAVKAGHTYLDAWAASNHPLDRYRTGRAAMEALHAGRPGYAQEFRCYNRYGQIQWLREDVALERCGPQTWRARAVCTDVTGRARLDSTCEQLADHFRDLFEQAADMMVILDLDGRLVDVNPCACAGLGHERRLLLSLSATDIDPDLEPGELARLWPELRQGPIMRKERTLRRKDGTTLPVEVNLAAFHDGAHPLLMVTARDISERKRMMQALQESEARYRQIVETTHEGILMLDAEARVTFANARAAEMLGTPVEGLFGRPVVEFHREESRGTFETQFAERRRGAPGNYEVQFARADGSTLWAAVSAIPLRDAEGQFRGSLGMIHDLTARKKAEADLHQVVTRARCILWSASIREAPPDSGRAFDWDMTVHDEAAAQQVVPLNVAPGQPYDWAWYLSRPPEDRERTNQTSINAIRSGQTGYSQEFRSFDREGRVRWLREEVSLEPHRNGTWSAVGVCTDITERKALEEQLAHQALHDALTDLPNRTLFMDRLTHALDQAARRQEPLAVVFVDLDGFKAVNDSLGHRAGDRLLVTIGRRLAASIRDCDTVARLGGDEFSLLLEGVEGLSSVTAIVERALDSIRVPVWLEGHEVEVTASLGIALGGSEDDTPEDLLRHADLALYEAKRHGKARLMVFDPGLLEAAGRIPNPG